MYCKEENNKVLLCFENIDTEKMKIRDVRIFIYQKLKIQNYEIFIKNFHLNEFFDNIDLSYLFYLFKDEFIEIKKKFNDIKSYSSDRKIKNINLKIENSERKISKFDEILKEKHVTLSDLTKKMEIKTLILSKMEKEYTKSIRHLISDNIKDYIKYLKQFREKRKIYDKKLVQLLDYKEMSIILITKVRLLWK